MSVSKGAVFIGPSCKVIFRKKPVSKCCQALELKVSILVLSKLSFPAGQRTAKLQGWRSDINSAAGSTEQPMVHP